MKWCNGCKQDLPFSSFHKMRRNGKEGYQSYCKACKKSQWKSRYHANPEASARRNKESGLKHRYGISLAQFEQMLLDQDGKCPICLTDDPKGKGWVIDHDHSCCPGTKTCGKCVRSIICHDCNLMIGYAKDNPDNLANGIKYLESFS